MQFDQWMVVLLIVCSEGYHLREKGVYLAVCLVDRQLLSLRLAPAWQPEVAELQVWPRVQAWPIAWAQQVLASPELEQVLASSQFTQAERPQASRRRVLTLQPLSATPPEHAAACCPHHTAVVWVVAVAEVSQLESHPAKPE